LERGYRVRERRAWTTARKYVTEIIRDVVLVDISANYECITIFHGNIMGVILCFIFYGLHDCLPVRIYHLL
jgi:hypothetical protein